MSLPGRGPAAEQRQPQADSGPRDPDVGVPELVAGAQGGDPVAFEQLYRLYVGRIHALCLRLSADRGEAERLTQDAFVRAWQKLATYAATGSFLGWLRRLAVNVVIEDHRARARAAGRLESWPEAEDSRAGAIIDPAPGPSDSSDVRRDLERAIAALPPGARLAFVLHDVQGYRHQEIADLAGIAVGTVKAQLHRARRLLRDALEDPRGSAVS